MVVNDAYVIEAGLSAEDEGFDALIMDTVSDSGIYALRSRLSIPVIGPGTRLVRRRDDVGEALLDHHHVGRVDTSS